MQEEYHSYLIQHVASQHVQQEGKPLIPSEYLGVEVSMDQRSLLQPSSRDVALGNALRTAFCDDAKKKIAQRKISFLTGNVASHSQLLNGDEQRQQHLDYLRLAASLGELNAERDVAKAERARKNRADAAEKEAKKAAREADQLQKRAELLPLLTADVNQGIEHIRSLTLARLKDILKYYFADLSIKGISTIKREVALAKIAELLEEEASKDQE